MPPHPHSETAGGIILNGEGLIAIVRQPNPAVPWSFPKGHREAGEDVLTAAKREIEEETGLTKLELIKQLPPYDRMRLSKTGEPTDQIKRLHYFIFRTSETLLAPKDPDNPEAKWVPREEVVNYFTMEKDKEFFLSILPELPQPSSPHPRTIWFKRKRYGWGWTPCTWQGWAITLGFVVLIVGFALTLDSNSSPREIMFTYVLPVTLLTITLIRIAYKTGETPRWQWGDKKQPAPPPTPEK